KDEPCRQKKRRKSFTRHWNPFHKNVSTKNIPPSGIAKRLSRPPPILKSRLVRMSSPMFNDMDHGEGSTEILEAGTLQTAAPVIGIKCVLLHFGARTQRILLAENPIPSCYHRILGRREFL